MNPSEKMIKADRKFIEIVSSSISNAIGDDIKGDIKSQGLITHNSTPTRIWDHLNTNLCKNFNGMDIIAHKTKRGSWELVPVFEKETGFLYVLMRENRFKILKKESSKRKKAHYTEALAKTLNKDLQAKYYQLALGEDNDGKFNDADYVRGIVQKIFEDLNIPNNIVKRHALILFNDVNGMLSSLRCCIIDSNLNIVEDEIWNEYIKVSESMVVDEAIDETSKFNDPTNGLKYKQKAKDKIGQKRIGKGKRKEEDESDLS